MKYPHPSSYLLVVVTFVSIILVFLTIFIIKPQSTLGATPFCLDDVLEVTCVVTGPTPSCSGVSYATCSQQGCDLGTCSGCAGLSWFEYTQTTEVCSGVTSDDKFCSESFCSSFVSAGGSCSCVENEPPGPGSPTPTPSSSPTPTPVPGGIDDAICDSQIVPSTMITGQSYVPRLVFINSGTSIWINDGNPLNPNNHRLGSQNPPNNNIWGPDWVWWPANLPISPGQSVLFDIAVNAPATPGLYNWQWQMQRAIFGSGFFGSACPNVIVNVIPPPTLSVTLAAAPPSGPTPLNSLLSAAVGGTATGTINYNFWWNCSSLSNSVSTVQSVCGVLPSPAAGFCAPNANGFKCLAVTTNPRNVNHIYTVSSTAKVIVERGLASPVEARTPIAIVNGLPSATSVNVAEPDYCSSGPAAFVNWTYSDPEGTPQSAYQVQIDNQPSFVSPEIDSGKVLSSGTSYFATPLVFNTTYKARVRVWDALDAPSAWQEQTSCSGPGCLPSNQWKTPKHAYPAVDFTWLPLLAPAANQLIQFSDLTTFFDVGGVGARAWSWLFNAPSPTPSSTVQNPTHTYTVVGSYNVTETVTDKDGYVCARTKPLSVQRPIPIWKEVSPK